MATTKIKNNGKWMSVAVKKPGAFTATAKAAGKSVAGEIKSALKPGSKASAKTKKRAVLARTFRKIANKRKGSPKKKRATTANMPGDEAGKAMQ